MKNSNQIIIKEINNKKNNNNIFEICKFQNEKFINNKEGIYI